jgi:hypothetical protein
MMSLVRRGEEGGGGRPTKREGRRKKKLFHGLDFLVRKEEKKESYFL